jgi:hypothetical protein
VEELKTMMIKSGFVDIEIHDKNNSDEIIRTWDFGKDIEKMVFSAYIKARKPA